MGAVSAGKPCGPALEVLHGSQVGLQRKFAKYRLRMNVPVVRIILTLRVLSVLTVVAARAAATPSRLRQNLTPPEFPHNSPTLRPDVDAHDPFGL
jgi:hypothetical protein